MSRSSYVMPSGYRSRVASRSRRWPKVEYAASSRSSSEHCLGAASGSAGTSGVDRRSRSPGRRTTPPAPLRSMMPTAVSTPPASSGRQRERTLRAMRIRPMTTSSPPVRIHLRIRLVRAGRVSLEAPYLSAAPTDALRTPTTFRRCDRSLIAASRTPAPLLLNATLPRSFGVCRPGTVQDPAGSFSQVELRGTRIIDPLLANNWRHGR
jgi:hypothetical protein